MFEVTDNLKSAIYLLNIYTGGSFDVWSLAGSSKASCRAHVMSALHGKKMPQSKSGVNALQAELFCRVDARGDYERAREKDCQIKCRGILNS